MTICRYCESSRLAVVHMPPGSKHYAKRVCQDCGRSLDWLPWPALDLDALDLPPGVPEGEPLPALVGSPKQVPYAESVRRNRLAVWCPHLPADLLEAVRSVAEADWWLSNAKADHRSIRWPRSWARATHKVAG